MRKTRFVTHDSHTLASYRGLQRGCVSTVHLNNLHKQRPGKTGITDYGKQVLQKLARGHKLPGVTYWPHEAGNLDPVRQQVAEAVAALSANGADSPFV